MKRIAGLVTAVLLALGATDAPAQAHAESEPLRLAVQPAVLELRGDLDAILDAATSPGATYTALVTSLDRRDTLYARSPDALLAPASNMKLFTTAAALYYLGPDFRYSTYLLIDGEVRDGTLIGDVILHGSGDPSISGRLLGDATAPLREMAGALRGMGITAVQGDVIGDGSVFDSEWLAPAWEEDDRMSWYAAPIGGLNFAENMVRVTVQPGETGGPARISTRPATVGLAIRSEVVTRTSGATRVVFDHEPGGIVVRGTIRRGHGGVTRTMPVVDPANYAAAALRAVLEEEGITVGGETRSGLHHGVRPRVVAEHRSPALREIAMVTNHVSHNLFAEALVKTLGRTVAGEGSFLAGGGAVRDFIRAETSVRPGAVVVFDGSGLSRPNRASPSATVALLEHLWRSDLGDEFLSTLPEAGDAEGLKRMYDTAAAGNLRAKTGTIRSVSALSGYVKAANGEQLAFSIIANGLPASWRAKSVEDRVGVRLAEFSR